MEIARPKRTVWIQDPRFTIPIVCSFPSPSFSLIVPWLQDLIFSALFLVTLLLSAPQQPCVGTARSQAILRSNATTIRSATCAAIRVTWLVIALTQVCPLMTQGCATTVTSRATLLLTAPTRRPATTAGKLVTLPVTAPTTRFAISAIYRVTWPVNAPSQTHFL